MEQVNTILIGIFLVILSIEDIRYKSLRVGHFMYMIPTGIVLGVINIYMGKLTVYETIAGIVMVLIIAVIGKISNGIGNGDIAVLFLLSVVCGGKKLFFGIAISLVFLYIMAMVFLFKRRLNKKTTFPYIPFLSMGMMWVLI